MLKVVHEIEAKFDNESERGKIVCPDCKMEWCSISITTGAGYLFDPVECDCGCELRPPQEVVAAYVKENKPDSTWPFTE